MNTPDWHRKMAEYAAEAGGLKTEARSFYFVRHGETIYNNSRVIQPLKGSLLSETGRMQAHLAGKMMKSQEFSVFCASDMERAWETASIMASYCGRAIHPFPDLHERDWGRWAGQSNVGLAWEAAPENGETLQEFIIRSLRGLEAALKVAKEVSVVAHGGTFAVLLAAIGVPLIRPTKDTSSRVVGNAVPMRVARTQDGAWEATPVQ